MNKRKLIILPLIALAVLVFAAVLKAQTPPSGLSLHPTNVDLSITPGSPQTGKLFLKNHTKNVVSIKAELRNFTAQGEEGAVNITNQETAFSLASWIKITPETVNIAPNQEAEFTYAINAPLNAEPGGHFGSIVFATVPSENVAGSAGSTVSQEIAALFLVRIPGNVIEKASIESFTADKNFYESGPANFTLRVKNEGGVHVKPAGVISLINSFGQKSVFGFDGQNVLPGAIRKMTITWDNKWLIGKYTASLALAYGSKNSQLYATTEFYAFPVRLAFVILAILLIIFFLRKRLWKAFRVIIRGK